MNKENKTKHTEGPWRIKNETYIGSTTVLGATMPNGGMPVICTTRDGYISMTPEEQYANAKLIASAPEMLEVLKDIRTWYEQNAHRLNRETPICFSKALSLIQATE